VVSDKNDAHGSLLLLASEPTFLSNKYARRFSWQQMWRVISASLLAEDYPLHHYPRAHQSRFPAQPRGDVIGCHPDLLAANVERPFSETF